MLLSKGHILIKNQAISEGVLHRLIWVIVEQWSTHTEGVKSLFFCVNLSTSPFTFRECRSRRGPEDTLVEVGRSTTSTTSRSPSTSSRRSPPVSPGRCVVGPCEYQDASTQMNVSSTSTLLSLRFHPFPDGLLGHLGVTFKVVTVLVLTQGLLRIQLQDRWLY